MATQYLFGQYLFEYKIALYNNNKMKTPIPKITNDDINPSLPSAFYLYLADVFL